MNLKISVELTFSPLVADYEQPIKEFIKKLRSSGLTVKENPLSTQVYGEYDTVMNLVQAEMKSALENVDSGLLFMKIVKTDRSDYEPNF